MSYTCDFCKSVFNDSNLYDNHTQVMCIDKSQLKKIIDEKDNLIKQQQDEITYLKNLLNTEQNTISLIKNRNDTYINTEPLLLSWIRCGE